MVIHRVHSRYLNLTIHKCMLSVFIHLIYKTNTLTIHEAIKMPKCENLRLYFHTFIYTKYTHFPTVVVR